MPQPVAIRLADKLAALPDSPGVYLMRDARGKIFYVGKAKSLRDRVRSYFTGADTRAFVATLDVWLDDLEVVLTHSEKEALLLENELIKAHQPRFNVKLTDDKRFLCLRLDVRQPYPRLQVVRRFGKDGARYFGPYHSASAIRESLRIINRHFQLRTCTDQMMRNRSRPCLQYQIKRCPAPCVFDLSDGPYADNIRDVTAFLEGRHTELVDGLTARMQQAAEAEHYELAGSLRDQIQAVQRSMERQRMVTPDFVNRDVVGMYREGPAVEIHLMRTRGGRLSDARRFSLHETEVPTSEVLAEFASLYYAGGEAPPDEILFPEQMEWDEALAQLLAERAGRAVRVLVPRRGDKRRLVELAMKNASQAFADKQREAGAAKTTLEKLQRALRLRHVPEHIECMDISHIMGTHIVASIVHFAHGVAHKPAYRHLKIRSTEGQDDFKSMYEVVSRRARRGLEQGDLPQLMVIDGGKGQLGAAQAALADLGVDQVDLVSLAKSRLLDELDAGRGASSARGGRRSRGSAGTAARLAAPPPDVAPASAAGPSPAEQEEQGVQALPALGAVPGAADAGAAPHLQAGPAVAEQGPEGAEGEPTALEALVDEAISSPVGGSAPRSAERVFVCGHKNPIVLRQNSAELFLLVRLRDEAHRFAITYHRKLRQKAATRSVLDEVAGIGPKRRRELLRAFGSVAQVRAASEEDLAAVVGPKVAAVLATELARRRTQI